MQNSHDYFALLSGPRQVGKTTLSKELYPHFQYLNFDSIADRKIIATQSWSRDKDLIIFDELHKKKNGSHGLKGSMTPKDFTERLKPKHPAQVILNLKKEVTIKKIPLIKASAWLEEQG